MSKKNSTWVIKKEYTSDIDLASVINDLKKEHGIDEDRDLSSLTLTDVLIDPQQVKKACKRIEIAIKKKEKIIIYGDYDVDGITGAAILWEILHTLNANVLPYIPHRVDEGYGLSEKGIDNLLAKDPPTLIITVDNGIVASNAVAYTKKQGIEVIITDHHLPDAHHMPDATAIVHTTKLCGSSVALFFGKEIKKYFKSESVGFEDDHIVMSALATVADLVPLTGVNRIILKSGLERISSTKIKGLQELILISGLSDKKITPYEIGHIIAPRLNATGRIESGMESLRLLCTTDRKRAKDLAIKLDQINSKRQVLMKENALHAIEKVGENNDKKILIVVDQVYEEGVIGLVAGKLVEQYHLPSIAIAQREDVSKGSVRSVSGIDIIKFLRKKPELFINVGGHPMAAGFTIKTEKIPEMIKILESLADKNFKDELLVKKLTIAAAIPLEIVSKELYSGIQSLSPFGMGNPQPVFLSRKVTIRDKRLLGKEGSHVRVVVSDSNYLLSIEAIGFSLVDKFEKIDTDDSVDLVYTVDENTWNGTTKLQLKIRDVIKI